MRAHAQLFQHTTLRTGPGKLSLKARASRIPSFRAGLGPLPFQHPTCSATGPGKLSLNARASRIPSLRAGLGPLPFQHPTCFAAAAAAVARRPRRHGHRRPQRPCEGDNNNAVFAQKGNAIAMRRPGATTTSFCVVSEGPAASGQQAAATAVAAAGPEHSRPAIAAIAAAAQRPRQ